MKKVVTVRVSRGLGFVRDESLPDLGESVTLSATPSRLLFLQLPNRFSLDGNMRTEKTINELKKTNSEYEA